MSASASSEIVVGTVIPLILEKYEGSYPRFDPKTGEPKVLKSPSLQVTLLLGKDQVPINLPEDTRTFEENRSPYEDFERWSRTRLVDRLRAFFFSQALVAEDYDHDDDDLCFYLFDNQVFLGTPFLEGYDSGYQDAESNVVFNLDDLQETVKDVQKRLNEWSLTKYSIELPVAPYLRTMLN